MNNGKNNILRCDMRWHPVAIAVMLTLPSVSYAAEISINNGTVAAVNNVPVININKANDKGLSHNVYDKLNVDKKGLIFNNSVAESTTMLAGRLQGNSNLTTGTAKVILNEVTSRNASAINGMMEVAGDKAHLIIANPNGISIRNSGTINTSKLTLTTGKPDVQNNQLAGYSVNGGTITLGKMSNGSPTEILSRTVVVNDKVSVDELKVVAGNNYVDAMGEVTGSVTASGWGSANSIDVAALGGMYANKINLVSTENGVGVRNLGVIAGGDNGISIDSKGQLLNSNARIESSGAINIKTSGTLNNTTGTVTSVGTIALDTNKNTLVNSRAGTITTAADLYINSSAIDNVNGKIAASGTLAVDTNNSTLTNSGKGKTVGMEAGIVALKTGMLNNSNGQIKGGYVGIESAAVNNNRGLMDSLGDVNMVSTGNVNNTQGLIRSAGGYTKISASTATVNNGSTKTADTGSDDSLGIIAEKGVQIVANSLNNNGGQMASNGDVSLESRGAIDNYAGKINATGKVIAKGSSLRNDNAGLSGKGGVVAAITGNITNYIGAISSEEGDIELAANVVNNYGGFMMGQNIGISANGGVNNNTALMVADKTLKIESASNIDNANSDNFGTFFGVYFGMPQQEGGMIGKEGVSLAGNNIYNGRSRIVAESGALTLQAKGSIDNARALLMSGEDTTIKTGWSFNNNYATTYSMGNLRIDTPYLENSSNGTLIDNNATGLIVADKDLVLNVNNNFTNYGWISSAGNATVNVLQGTLYNRKTLAAEAELAIDAQNGVENFATVSAGGDLSVNTKRHVTNNNNSNMIGNNVTITAVNDINNRNNIVSNADMAITTSGNLYNYLNLVSYGNASVSANSFNNNSAYLESAGDTTITTSANVGNNRGKIKAQTGNMRIASGNGNVDNYSGVLESGGAIDIKTNALNNDYGQIAATEAISLALKGNYDSFRGVLVSGEGDITLAANSVDNNYGLIAGANVTVDSKSAVQNDTALMAASQKLSVTAVRNIENRYGNNFSSQSGSDFDITADAGGMIGQEGVSLSGQNIYNNSGNIVANNGPLSLIANGVLDNTWGMLVSGADAIVKATGVFYNNYATTYSAGNLDITAATLYNFSSGNMADNTATGVIASDKDLTLKVDSSDVNYGWISSKGDLNFSVLKGILYNRNTISATNALTISTLNGVENFKDIVAGSSLKIDTQRHVTNNASGNILAQNIAINAGADINNRGNMVADYTLTAKTAGNIYNYLNMLSYGAANVTANSVTNSGSNAVFGGLTGMEITTGKVTNSGAVIGI